MSEAAGFFLHARFRTRVVLKKMKCEYCGTTFSRKLTPGPMSQYCSTKCRRATDNLRKRYKLGKSFFSKLCEYCFICFRTRRKNQRYCGAYCGHLAMRTLKDKKCLICGTTFRPRKAGAGCCSIACAKIKEGNTKRIYGPGDPRPKISKAVCDGVYRSIKNKGGRQWESLVDYTKEDLVKHLEKQFKPGMTWDNYGKWHIDHKIPIAAFNFTRPEHEDFKRCWSLKNLQPLWASENSAKGATLAKPFQPSLEI